MGFTYAWSNDYLNKRFRDTGGTTMSDNSHIGMSTTTPNIDGTNTTEPSSGYARTAISDAGFDAASGGGRTSNTDYSFTAGANWGTVTHILSYDALTVGNLLAFGALTASEQVFNTDTVKFAAGDITYSIGGDIGNSERDGWILFNLFDGIPASTSTQYLGLSTTAPNSDGTNVTEPVGGSYARLAVTATTGTWDAPSNGSIANTNDLTFTAATGSWGTLTHWVLYSASTAGTLYYFGALGASQAVGSGDQVKFLPGALTISVT